MHSVDETDRLAHQQQATIESSPLSNTSRLQGYFYELEMGGGVINQCLEGGGKYARRANYIKNVKNRNNYTESGGLSTVFTPFPLGGCKNITARLSSY